MGSLCCCKCNSKGSVDSAVVHKSIEVKEEEPETEVVKRTITVEELLTSGNNEGLKFTEEEREFVNIWKSNDGAARETTSTEHGECAVCFEPLCENKPTIMQNADKKRSCRHFICFDCAEDLLDTSRTCPLCRQSFEKIIEVPALLESPKNFFELLGDENKHLNKQDVQLTLNAILPISSGRIAMDVQLEWSKWDPEDNGYITFQQAKDSICHYVARKIHLPRFQKGVIPDISKHENAGLWFDYWDWDNRGRLAKHEIARAMLKTFSQLLKGKRGQTKIKQMCEMLLLDIWPVLELKDSRYIELDEFIKEDGLSHVLMQLLWQTMNKAPSTLDLLEMGLDSSKFDLNTERRPKSKAKPVRQQAEPRDYPQPEPEQDSIRMEWEKEVKEVNYSKALGKKRRGKAVRRKLTDSESKWTSTSSIGSDLVILGKKEKPHQRLAPTSQGILLESALEAKTLEDSKQSYIEIKNAAIPSKPFAEPLIMISKSSKDEAVESEERELFTKTISRKDGPKELYRYLKAGGLPVWWMRRETSDGRIYYQNNMVKKTSWDPPSDEQIRKEFENGAASWYLSRQQSYNRAKLKHAPGGGTPTGDSSTT